MLTGFITTLLYFPGSLTLGPFKKFLISTIPARRNELEGDAGPPYGHLSRLYHIFILCPVNYHTSYPLYFCFRVLIPPFPHFMVAFVHIFQGIPNGRFFSHLFRENARVKI